MALVVVVPVNAETTVWQATGNQTISEPITVDSVVVSKGTYDSGVWNYTMVGAGTATLTITVTNTGTQAYTLTMGVTSITPTPTAGTITTVWNYPTRDIGVGVTRTFILTVTTSAEVPLGTYNFGMSMTR